MRSGYLSQFFTGAAAKRLSAVEADSGRSHQHEYNGSAELVRLFGRATDRHVLPATFLYLTDADEEPAVEQATVTWYDARLKHRTRSEHRLYFPGTDVSARASAGDLLVIAKRQDGSVLVVIAESGSTVANQVHWLFGFGPSLDGFLLREDLETERDRIEFASTFILEQIGISVQPSDDRYLETMLAKFGCRFPSTREFSSFARSTVADVVPGDDPDAALMCWMEREEALFRTLERHLLAERLAQGFDGDVDGFLRFSLSVQNRRKSRVGLALENHLEVIFESLGLRFERAATTEGKARPDFLFPGQAAYRDESFNASLLTMLGVKSTCKERWRQVLAEARRIETKHLLTLETAISQDQTMQMDEHRVQLVVPRKLHTTFSEGQRSKLMDLREFACLAAERQSGSSEGIDTLIRRPVPRPAR